MTYEEYLEQNGTLTYRNVGTSMLPLLKQGRDLFTVTKKSQERCKKLDVVLYRRGKNYVLHRVVEVRMEDYVILGDNCLKKEYGIRDEDILGVMTEYVRKGKRQSCKSFRYRAYSVLWVKAYPIRVAIFRLKGFVKRCLGRG